MSRLSAIAVLLFVASAPASAARKAIGGHGGWAAFADDTPRRCYAIAAPRLPRDGAFASVASWPHRRVAGQINLRFERPARLGSAILLTIDGRVFQLVGRGAEAWAPNPAVDRAVIAAMRTGVTMAVSGRDERGAAFTDVYLLSGAATAIDAAALACRRERS